MSTSQSSLAGITTVSWFAPAQKHFDRTSLAKRVSLVHPNIAALKPKSYRRISRSPKVTPKLVFHYGPSYYRGSLLHRKVKIAPIAEYFQTKYLHLAVYYHPTNDYNTLEVKLQNGTVLRCSLSNVRGSRSDFVYKTVEEAVKRLDEYPNLLLKPFRDPICLMTHNLDVDYDLPWYRTPIYEPKSTVKRSHRDRRLVSFTDHIIAPCRVEYERNRNSSANETETHLWNKFRQKIESSGNLNELLQQEAPNLIAEK